ncbi:MAG: ornithine carbamoyltransferase [Actinomycetes bacterium]|nr:ornithine carbamoyltransferase [Candidatus Nanopelagicales bacterium]MDP4888762.1 ornithine carbamoyltransferase [Candidatus Nanopelagicales bacterium]
MAVDLRGRNILREADFSREELSALLRLSATLKADRRRGNGQPLLHGKSIALIFEKASTRTRCAFEVAAAHLGAASTYIDPASSHIGVKESAADTARVLSRMYDGIEFRGHHQQTIEELADFATVPVLNGLTDKWHPSQMLADFLTMGEHASNPQSLSYVYLGDARNNMGNSLLVMGAIMGSDVRILAPESLWPTSDVQELAQERASESGARLLLTADPEQALPGAAFVMTDVWVSMGEPDEVWAERVALLRPYRVTADTMSRTNRSDSRFMHCLPAYHNADTVVGARIEEDFGLIGGAEVTDEVFESPASIVFDQAENRLHTIKAMMAATMGSQPLP